MKQFNEEKHLPMLPSVQLHQSTPVAPVVLDIPKNNIFVGIYTFTGVSSKLVG